MDFKATDEAIKKALLATTRAATRINAADVPFQRSLNPAAGVALDKQNARLLQLARRLLENAAAGSDAVGPELPNVEALDEADTWRGFVDVIDSLLEKADTSLDEYAGVVKRLSPGAEQVRWSGMNCTLALLTNTGRCRRCCQASPQHCLCAWKTLP